MHAISQKCRPKHQVLVLKCYPRTTKGAVDVKPNSSELSYLLFYAQSRRTKIQKVGSFLEKKTASDVYRQRIGNVQVTLQILTALIEKAPKDLPLFAPCILTILEQILKSHDITMVESSIPTFAAFCEHHDPTSLLADQAYLRQYVSVVRSYASLASTRTFPGKVQPSKPVALRWRNSGLEAIKSVASSDALSSITGRQYDIAVPMILENLWTDNEDFLEVLLQRAQMEEKGDGALLRRRTSIATVRTADTSSEPNPNPIALTGTAADADKLAEEDIGVLAMQSLKQIFVSPNRSQIHAATAALLSFIEERVNELEEVVKTNAAGKDSGWAITMFLLVARWAPVQDRFTILVTAMDALAQRPLTDDDLRHHIVLVAMIGSLLRSDINLIGLSVMDVLLQLVTHIRRLVQMPGDPNNMRSDPPLPGKPDLRSPTTLQFAERAELVAAQRKDLLVRLQDCIGDLATHVYYADQISDMIATILVKLKPSRSSSTSSSSPPGEKAENSTGPAGSTSAFADDQHLDSLFSLTVAKIAALKAIKAILLVANPRTKMSGNVGLSRTRVPIQVWDGTQWLLRDPDGYVRKAYADALLTWLDRETTRADLRARDETARATLKNRDVPGATVSKRAVSGASARLEKPVKVPRSHFLQLLHLAIYDNAVQYVDYETDIVLLHVLLAKLVNQLGVNAVRYGLPMIFRLQEDIQDAETPVHKVRIGSLAHGYFWILTEKFDFEASVVGRAIHNEIIRRRSKNFWVEGVHYPTPLLELVGTPGMARPQPRLPLKEIESEALLPFDDRVSLVECICASYQEHVISPPTSPAASPGRSFTHPILGSTLSTVPAIETEQEIPSYFREQMLVDWTREGVLAAVQAGSKSASLNGSRTGTTGTNRNRLASNGGGGGGGGLAPNGHTLLPGASSPFGSNTNLRPSSSPVGGTGGYATKRRKSSVRSNISPPGSTISKSQGVTTVEQLKLVLSGHLQPPATSMGVVFPRDDDSSSDSLVSYDMTPSELSFNPAADGLYSSQRSTSRERNAGGPLSSHPMTHEPLNFSDEDEVEDLVPPVPPLPSGFEGSRPSKTAVQDHAATLPRPTTSKRSVKSRGGERASSWGTTDEKPPAMDLAALLMGIDSHAGEQSLGTVTKPPY
ncbi:hypothetical protein QBC46DRAFT_378172 [Diplogelasinospora grovesii]|uniref:Protein EFR3 n=1 Tax=Diplogelasinospora grovesii TaxID=303347 RepID=A0AAN6S6N2_9PEZI|nr:hypothetical protein QBC46DRAFT_378172 [Diplogelasinospora grovesii]